VYLTALPAKEEVKTDRRSFTRMITTGTGKITLFSVKKEVNRCQHTLTTLGNIVKRKLYGKKNVIQLQCINEVRPA
jgi:hypothetical protein